MTVAGQKNHYNVKLLGGYNIILTDAYGNLIAAMHCIAS